MKIAVLDGATPQLVNKEIEVSLHRLGFSFSGPLATAAETANIDHDAVITSIIGTAVLTVQLQDGVSSPILLQRIALSDVLEMAAFQRGLVTIKRAFDGAVAGNNIGTVEFTLPLSNGGSLMLNDRSKIILNLESKVAGVSLTIDTIDHPAQSSSIVRYESKYLNANTEKEVGTLAHFAAAFPIANLVSLQLYYSNGRVCQFTKDELRKSRRDAEDAVMNVNGRIVNGFNKLIVIELEAVTKMVIMLDTNANIYLVRNQAI